MLTSCEGSYVCTLNKRCVISLRKVFHAETGRGRHGWFVTNIVSYLYTDTKHFQLAKDIQNVFRGTCCAPFWKTVLWNECSAASP